ncbi:MAG: hypothetical protein ACFFE5_14885, partial [Candidatus Thorarchaeota archaeon]
INMRPSRVFRTIFRIFIFLLTLSVTFVSILGGMSVFMILGNPNNIGLDPSEMDPNFDISPLNINFTLPFNFTNAGYFDLENLRLKVDLAMNYTDTGVNQSLVMKIFNKTHNFGTILKGETGNFNITGLFSDFYFPPSFNFTTDVDWSVGPPAIIFLANFTFSLDYTLGLHSLTIGILNIPVGGFP